MRELENITYQLQHYIDRREEQDRQDMLAHRKLCMIYVGMIAAYCVGCWLIA